MKRLFTAALSLMATGCGIYNRYERPDSVQVEADSLQTVTKIVRDAQKINPRLAAHVLLYKCQPNTFSEQQELRDSLNSHDYWLKPMKSTVSFLRAFVRAMNQGMGVHELKSNVSGASQAKAQIELLLKELEL